MVEKAKLEGIYPKNILDNVSNIINGQNINLGEFASKVKIIPFKSLGKENGILLGVKMDEVQITYQDLKYEIKNVIIGIYNGSLSKNGKYSALVGVGIFK